MMVWMRRFQGNSSTSLYKFTPLGSSPGDLTSDWLLITLLI